MQTPYVHHDDAVLRNRHSVLLFHKLLAGLVRQVRVRAIKRLRCGPRWPLRLGSEARAVQDCVLCSDFDESWLDGEAAEGFAEEGVGVFLSRIVRIWYKRISQDIE